MSQFPHQIYLTDFGLAEKKGGTPVFASPECFDDSKHNSDIFSLGRVFFIYHYKQIQFFTLALFTNRQESQIHGRSLYK